MKWFWLILVAVIIIVGAWYMFMDDKALPNDEGVDVSTDSNGVFTADMAPMTETVVYNGSDFTPKDVVVKKGGTITFVNQSDKKMWVASAMHPTHDAYDGTAREAHCPNVSNIAFDQCMGEEGDYSFMFDKAGNWNYHDHLMLGATGRVMVVE